MRSRLLKTQISVINDVTLTTSSFKKNKISKFAVLNRLFFFLKLSGFLSVITIMSFKLMNREG